MTVKVHIKDDNAVWVKEMLGNRYSPERDIAVLFKFAVMEVVLAQSKKPNEKLPVERGKS